MNHRMIRYIVFWALRVEGVFMVLCAAAAILFGEIRPAEVYWGVSLSLIALGTVFTARKPEDQGIYRQDGMVAVALGWIAVCAAGALPFLLCGEAETFVDALFESVSGFTTTGATIFNDVEALSKTSLLWRSLSHWIGGIGVLVFILMVLPVRDGTRMNLMKAESPGPDVQKFVPKVRSTAAITFRIYIVMTVLQFALLLCSGMDAFSDLCISLGTAGTGGFAVLNSGCAEYTPLQQWIIGIFMMLFGVNFSFYYLMSVKKPGKAFGMEEVRAYFLIIVSFTALIALNIAGQSGMKPGEAIRCSFFQVASIITTTGFSSCDFNLWPSFSKALLFVLMLTGACAGSTGGGFKVSRLLVLIKAGARQIGAMLHPRSVKKISVDGKPADDEYIKGILVFTGVYVLIMLVSFILVSTNGLSMETNISAVAASFNNVGPGFDAVGPLSNFAAMPAFSKMVFIVDMLLGRLEIYPILVLLIPTRKKI